MNNKIIAYSLLAHINESQQLSKNYESLFAPLVKRLLAQMSRDRSFEGADIIEIKEYVDKEYGWDIPPATLKKLLQTIETEVNAVESAAAQEKDPTDPPQKVEVMRVYQDGSFAIKPHIFSSYDEEIEKRNRELKALESVYLDFLNTEKQATIPISSIYDFVEQGKASLGKYINKKYQIPQSANTIEARFMEFIAGIPKLYEVFQNIYIGSIISTYLEYEPKEMEIKVELVLDTNFVISLLDLNTEQSTTNCWKLIELGKKLGYRFTVLDITLREIDSLLHIKIEFYNSSFLASLINPEDIYNACRRRNLNKTDLEKIRNDVEKQIASHGISIVPNTSKYEHRAQYSEEFTFFRQFRNSDFAALHDATCIDYVNTKRGRLINEFSRVNCWFVNNSSTKHTFTHSSGNQPFTIKAEDLLNMLWLSSPRIKRSLSAAEFATIGLSRLVASTLIYALPKARIIDDLDRNITKYAEQDISDEDLVRVSKSIGTRSFTTVAELNELADTDGNAFVSRLRSIAEDQKEKETRQSEAFNRVLQEFSDQAASIKEERKKIAKTNEDLYVATMEKGSLVDQLKRERKARLEIENGVIKNKRKQFEKQQLQKWRRKSWIQLGIASLIPILVVLFVWLISNTDQDPASLCWSFCKDHLLISFIVGILYLFIPGFIFAGLNLKYNSPSNISTFKKDIIYPSDMIIIEEDDLN